MAREHVLDPSELGTKEYWDAVYDRELNNNSTDETDEGTVWFSESNAEDVVLRELSKLEDKGLIFRTYQDRGTSRSRAASNFLDLGTGNGHMLFALREDANDDDQNWEGELVGVDYSEASVQLARRIAEQRFPEPNEADRVNFERWDVLADRPGAWLGTGFDVVLDKGTFDAISLMPHLSSAIHPCEDYRRRVGALIRNRMFLFVTSCNWTKGELIEWLAGDDSELEVYGEAKYPTFTFGGRTGQAVVTVIFRRKAIGERAVTIDSNSS